MYILKPGATGSGVVSLQQSLREHGFDPGSDKGDFDLATEAAVLAFQKSEHLLPDGLVGPETSAALGLPPQPGAPDITLSVTPEMVSHMFPATLPRSIAANLPAVLDALRNAGLGDRQMVLTALATIRAEAAPFEPLEEAESRFNTSPNGAPFDLYDRRKDLGNQGSPDGAAYRGRGYVQLTGRVNYASYGPRLTPAEDLITQPARARDPAVAARLLALFLSDKQRPIRLALLQNDLWAARKLVNGGSHGLNDFIDAFRAGQKALPDGSARTSEHLTAGRRPAINRDDSACRIG